MTATGKLRKVLVIALACCIALAAGAFIAHKLLETKPSDPDSLTRRAPGALVILCAGDSITRGDAEGSYPAKLEKMLIERGLNAEVVNAGASGFTSGEYLDYLVSKKLLEKLNPHVILLQLGTNDARSDFNKTSTAKFVENMTTIIDLAARHKNNDGTSPLVFISTIPKITATNSFNFTEESKRRVDEEINPAIRKLAQSKGLVLADTAGVLGEDRALLPGIHPSQEGYKAMAANWLKVLIDELPKHGKLDALSHGTRPAGDN